MSIPLDVCLGWNARSEFCCPLILEMLQLSLVSAGRVTLREGFTHFACGGKFPPFSLTQPEGCCGGAGGGHNHFLVQLCIVCQVALHANSRRKGRALSGREPACLACGRPQI